MTRDPGPVAILGAGMLTPDDRFVVGPDPGLEGFFWVAGLGGHGMSAGLAAGRVAADLIVGEHPAEADVLSPGRF